MPESQASAYQLTKEDLLRSFQTTEQGLSHEEAEKRLAKFGQNKLTPPKPKSALQIYLSQFNNSLTLVLIGAAALVFLIYFIKMDSSDLIEGTLILAIIILITLLGFLQEYKAERALDALKELLAHETKVFRNGKEQIIDVGQLVPGDVVILEEGETVPADIRLLTAASLITNEASLTGESNGVNKTTDPLSTKLGTADQTNMAFSGTIVSEGRGTGVVIKTGNHTEIGQIAKSVAEVEDEATPIQERLDQVGKTLGFIVLVISAVVFVFIVFFARDLRTLPIFERVVESFVAAVALAVAAIPEGLPAVVTITLAIGTQRMLKRRALVRRLASIETLGSTDVICADKTGTLTKGEMTVRQLWTNNRLYEVTGTGYQTAGEFKHDNKTVDPSELKLLLEIGLICNNADLDDDEPIGDTTEIALLVSAQKAKITTTAKRLEELPFSSARKMMSVIVETNGQKFVYTKGAPEVVLAKSQTIMINGQKQPLTDELKKTILDQTLQLSGRSLRTLGFAYKELRSGETPEDQLTFVGLQGMIDPPRTEVIPLINRCHQSGIRVIMITGDHAATATAIAHEIGLKGEAVTGEELDALPADKFTQVIRTHDVYARVNPGFKMRIVEALKKLGHTVAMTGDGVNDAPALKMADIGVAMGKTGTDVSKGAADMILLDDHFNTIVAAIEEGRGIFDNIRKFINYLLSCNISEVVIVFLAVIIYQDLALTAVMLLWINVVTDGLPAVALAMDPAQKNIISLPPKRFQEEIITKRLWWEMIIWGLILGVAVLGSYALNINEGLAEARAAAFVSIVFFEIVRLFNIRARYQLPIFSNLWLIGAIASSLLLQVLIVYQPTLAKLFEVTAIDGQDWLYIGLVSVALWLLSRLTPRFSSQ